MRQKATAARPPANAPALAVVPQTHAGPVTVQLLGQQLRDLLPPRRLHSVSVCDHEANVLWLSEGALGPDEHSVVMEALTTLAADRTMHCHEAGLEDGRHGLFLPVRSPTGNVVGIAMILADSKSAGDDTQERVAAAPVRAIMQRLAVLMKPETTRNPEPIPVEDDESTLSPLLLELVPELEAAPPVEARGPPTKAPAAKAPPAPAPKMMSAEEVNDILEFDLGLGETAAPAAKHPAPAAPLESPFELVSLEFLSDTQSVPSLEELASIPVAEPAKITPRPSAPPARAAANPVRAPAPTAPLAPRAAAVSPAPVAPAPAPAQPTSPPPAAVAPAIAPPVNDANLILEVLPYAKLRAGGQTRRFQLQARTSTPQRDPAALDALILQRLLGWLAAHRGAWSSQPTSFTVNLSIATLEDERFPQKIAAALNAHGIAAETLGFEIAEALCTQRRAQVERFINQCDKLGCWVVVDDFTFDSQVLPLLRSKAVRLVKISPKLTSSALKDKLSQALVVATVQAAKVMGVHCGAKKVDSQAAMQWLTAIGCDFAQGTALSPAQPLDALAATGEPTITTAAVRES